MDKRRDLFLIYKEAINNLIKYSKATKAEIRLHEGDNMIYLTIKDNGIGFDPAQVKHGNGLINMRNRATAHLGILKISSHPGQGTLLELRMKTK